jgi:GNAT superfamily N-acetyltransferase
MEYIADENLYKLRPLLEEFTLDYPIIMGILDGTFKGHALADNKDNPKKALVFHKYIGLLHYMGSPPDETESIVLANAALDYRSNRNYCNVVEFAHYPKRVAQLIEGRLGKIKRYNRISWNHDLSLFNASPGPETDDCTIVSFLKKEHFENTFVRLECEMFWESYDVFLEKAFGTIAHDIDGKFMGVCGAVSNSAGFHEINIETAKEHRRKGIGYAIAHKYIRECYQRGMLPHWDCYDYNEPSQSLAKKLGFTEAGRYPLISWVY